MNERASSCVCSCMSVGQEKCRRSSGSNFQHSRWPHAARRPTPSSVTPRHACLPHPPSRTRCLRPTRRDVTCPYIQHREASECELIRKRETDRLVTGKEIDQIPLLLNKTQIFQSFLGQHIKEQHALIIKFKFIKLSLLIRNMSVLKQMLVRMSISQIGSVGLKKVVARSHLFSVL